MTYEELDGQNTLSVAYIGTVLAVLSRIALKHGRTDLLDDYKQVLKDCTKILNERKEGKSL